MNPTSSHSTVVFPLEMHWTNPNIPIYNHLTASELRTLFNSHFEELGKPIKVRRVEYLKSPHQNEEISTKELLGNKGRETPYGTKWASYQQQGRADCTNQEKAQSESKLKDISFVKMNINTLIEIYFYSKPTIFISQTEEILNKRPFGGKVTLLVEMPREEYKALDSYLIDITDLQDLPTCLSLHHPEHPFEFPAFNRTKSKIENWCISCEVGENTLSHYLDIESISEGAQRINHKIKIKNHIVHSKHSEFELVCEMFNGLAVKFNIPLGIVRACKLHEQGEQDVFYFYLSKEPELSTIIKDYRVSVDIEFDWTWKRGPSLLSSRYLGFLNHSLFNDYFSQNNVLTIRAERFSDASYFLRSYCFQIKGVFKLVQEPHESIHMLSMLSKMNHNHFEEVNSNMFISPQIKFQLLYILKGLLMTGQLSMIDALNVFKMNDFSINVELFVNILYEMSMSQECGFTWVKVRYETILQQYQQQTLLPQ